MFKIAQQVTRRSVVVGEGLGVKGEIERKTQIPDTMKKSSPGHCEHSNLTMPSTPQGKPRPNGNKSKFPSGRFAAFPHFCPATYLIVTGFDQVQSMERANR
jgi:hypothetical protein